jgi:hypothetical protein
MKGRDRFTPSEADEIRRVLGLVRKAEPGTAQKLLRDQLRAIGFYNSDFAGGPSGFTGSQFDDLVRSGRIEIGDAPIGSDQRHRRRPRSSPLEAKHAHKDVSHGRERAKPSVLPPGCSDVSAALSALSAEPMSIATSTDGGVPDRPGLYALQGSEAVWQGLGLGSPPDARPLYVGKAGASLVSRRARRVSLRRAGRSPLSCRRATVSTSSRFHGRHDPEPKKWTHYALEERGDQQLTEWMRDHLLIAVWPSPARTHLATVEGADMQKWLPPLNLIGVHTVLTSQVKAARAAMAARAREWARERGFDV